MKLRTRLDVFSTALLSALGASPLIACGGSALVTGDPGVGGAGNTGLGGASASGASAGAVGTAGSGQGGVGIAGEGSAGAAANAGDRPNKYPCTASGLERNGFERCGGFTHRGQKESCTSLVPRAEPVRDFFMVVMCKYDADCTDKPHGWCTAGQNAQTYCEYGCVTDSECASDQICECNEPVGRCVAASCTSDADCKTGYLCRSYDATGGCGPTIYACQSPADTCSDEASCNTGDSLPGQCRFDVGAQHFQCIPGSCAIGRPFLVEGAQRLAPVAARTGWAELARLPRAADLDEALRAHLADAWTRIALMEHASIAAFARFTLQLMSLGAPASLIELATAAIADETKHAKACFAVASSYAAAPVGPGCLAIEGSLDESSLTEIVLNAIREGCVGETVAAIEAREAAQHASDPALRELLSVISEDETRHAELAYRFVKWALSQGGPELERAVRGEFAALAAGCQPAPPRVTAPDTELLRHGIVPDAMRQMIQVQTMTHVILPCSRALLPSNARRASFVSASV